MIRDLMGCSMNNWTEACTVADLAMNNLKKVSLEGADILIVRTDEGIFAIDDTCSHAEVSLSEGTVIGCTIECWAHGAVFDVRDGSVVTPPASEPLKTYATQIHGDGANAIISIKIGTE